jgi:hypothetical protein
MLQIETDLLLVSLVLKGPPGEVCLNDLISRSSHPDSNSQARCQ